MKKRSLLIAYAIATLGICGTAVSADSCTWSTQSDGSQWGTCVDDNGRMYCLQCRNGSCSRVSCR